MLLSEWTCSAPCEPIQLPKWVFLKPLLTSAPALFVFMHMYCLLVKLSQAIAGRVFLW